MRRIAVAAVGLAVLLAEGPRDMGREPPAEGDAARNQDCGRRLSDMRGRMRHPGTPIEVKAALAEAYARDCWKPGGR